MKTLKKVLFLAVAAVSISNCTFAQEPSKLGMLTNSDSEIDWASALVGAGALAGAEIGAIISAYFLSHPSILPYDPFKMYDYRYHIEHYYGNDRYAGDNNNKISNRKRAARNRRIMTNIGILLGAAAGAVLLGYFGRFCGNKINSVSDILTGINSRAS